MALFQLNSTDSLQEDFKKAGESIPFSGLLRWTIIAIGLPINFLVAWVILRNRQLHNPRNAFWLGNIFCHLVTLLMGALEAILFMNPQREPPNVFCYMYALLVGSPYTNLLVSRPMDRHKSPVVPSQTRHCFSSGRVSRVVVGPGVGRIDESLLVGQVPASILFRPSGNHEVGNFFLLGSGDNHHFGPSESLQ